MTMMPADIDGIDAESGRFLVAGHNTVFGANMGMDRLQRFCGKGRRIIEQLATGQGAETGVEVIETVSSQFQRHCLLSEHLLRSRPGNPVSSAGHSRPRRNSRLASQMQSPAPSCSTPGGSRYDLIHQPARLERFRTPRGKPLLRPGARDDGSGRAARSRPARWRHWRGRQDREGPQRRPCCPPLRRFFAARRGVAKMLCAPRRGGSAGLARQASGRIQGLIL